MSASDIESWSFTITPAGGAAFTASSSDPGASLYVIRVDASASSITVNPVAGGSELELYNYSGGYSGGDLLYENDAITGNTFDFAQVNIYSYVWFNQSFATLGGTNPWVVAVASVPEPSSVVMLGAAAVWFVVFKRRPRWNRAA